MSPWRNVSIWVPAVVVVGQVAEVLHLLVVENEGELWGIPFKTNISTFASKNWT